jgi:urate oxidase
MAVLLDENQYGKAEIRLLKVDREDLGGRHVLHDLEVGVALSGDLAAAHVHGDNANVLPTDSQKNTVYAFARQHGVGQIEEFGLRLARHFVDRHEPIARARVTVAEHAWDRIDLGGRPAPHSFAASGREVRTATLTYDGQHAHAVSGLADLLLLSSTGSEFRGFLQDEYTTLAETDDRILCTSVTARWRHRSATPTAGRCSRRSTRWESGCSPVVPAWRRSGSRCPTGTTSWST